jgi:hypothetical protein
MRRAILWGLLVGVSAVILFLLVIAGAERHDGHPQSLDRSHVSLHDTDAWLKVRLPMFCSVSYILEGKSHVQTAGLEYQGINNCRVTWTETYEGPGPYQAGDGTHEDLTVTFSLGDIDPLSVSVRDDLRDSKGQPIYRVGFDTTNALRMIHFSANDTLDGGISKQSESDVSSEYLYVDSLRDARRIVPALRHAIELCGGIAEPF